MTQLSKAMKLERENLQPSPEALLASTSAIALGQLTATFVHEIKNSLNNLNLTVQNIIDDLQTESGLSPNSGYIEKLSVVLSEIRRCDGLSRRLQETALRSLRPEKGEHHINEIVRRSLQLIDTALRRKAITIQARLDPRLDPPAGSAPGIPFSIDANQILQVLLNILQNAIDASPERGRILIETRADAGHAEVRVTDHGEGVPEDIRRKLFKPFSTTKKEGLGLGLFLSRILIEENHGGKIDLQSTKVGAGATFVIRIPEAIQVVSALGTPKIEPLPQIPRQEPVEVPTDLLLVEDERLARHALAEFLKKRGFSVQQVASGASAVAHAKKKKVGIVLMDIVLGDKMDGIEAARKIQREQPMMSFIFVSAYAQDPSYQRRALESGLRVGAWIEKPVRVHDLVARIEKEQRKLQILAYLEKAKARGLEPRSYLHAVLDLDRSLEPDIVEEILNELQSSGLEP